ncbi:MAG: diguanylate cyclase [Acidobacteriota bacterium]
MTAESFLDENFRVLTSEAFDFVLHNELKRAVRSQNFLTLVHVEPTLRGQPADEPDERDAAVREIARLISREVRETDLLAQTATGRLSLVLLDADMPNSLQVIERLMARLDHYQFRQPLAIEVGAACCPTHGADVDSLKRAAESRSVHPRRDARGNASNA